MHDIRLTTVLDSQWLTTRLYNGTPQTQKDLFETQFTRLCHCFKTYISDMAHCNELYPSEILGENKNKILQKSAHRLYSFQFIVLFTN